MSSKEPAWDAAFKEELERVRKNNPGKKAALVGLAFSGGGIRSATFNLGVLEALKELNLLKTIDYLSTVSGGGYIGAWLTANCTRHLGWREPNSNWRESIRHLRRYSNYLAPTVGFFSADTWSVAMVWIRNTLLVQATVILAIATAMVVPRLVFPIFIHWPKTGNWRWTSVILFIAAVVGIAANQLRVSRSRGLDDGCGPDAGEGFFVLRSEKWLTGLLCGAACLAAAGALGYWWQFKPFPSGPFSPEARLVAVPIAALLVAGGFFLLPVGAKVRGARQINYGQGWVQLAVVAPMMAVGLLVAAVLWGQLQGGTLSELDTFSALFLNGWRYWSFPLTVLFPSLALLAYCSVRTVKTLAGAGAVVLASLASVVALHALLCAVVLLLEHWAAMGTQGEWTAFVWAPSIVLYAFSLAIVALIGIVGRQSTEGAREWWSRLGAWLGIYGLAWTVVSVASIYGPLLVTMLVEWKYSVSGGWIASTAAGLFAGKSGSTGGKDTTKSTFDQAKEIVAVVAPFVFIAGLLVAVAAVVHLIVRLNSPERTLYWGELDVAAQGLVNWAVLGGCAGLLALLASRVDINEFSLNAFYRSRLVRCYLGATRAPEDRHPQRFTNFDDGDDIRMATLSGGPLHIVNCALNLGGSSDLSVHTRHSANFTLTPLRCGSRYMSRADSDSEPKELGYVSTNEYGGPDGQPSLGQAISVSGAAASPNMGYHTSTPVAFLLTLFNVRLGWWFPKPEPGRTSSPTPWFSLRYLFMELFGFANDRARFLSISDGGHFENLAAYELIKRRCKVVVVGDAECDPDLKFEGLGTLIRVCEVDFNARIKVDVAAIGKGDSEWSLRRCAVGRIQYEGDPEDSPSGIFIYLKASMTRHEGTSILQYKASHAAFPHESTGDQFYGEDQFESYRLLGKEIADTTFRPATSVVGNDMVRVAEKLVDVWPPLPGQVAS